MNHVKFQGVSNSLPAAWSYLRSPFRRQMQLSIVRIADVGGGGRKQHTFGEMVSVAQESRNISRLGIPNRLEFLAVRDLQMRSHIISTVSQVDLQPLVSEDLLLVAEDGIREGWVEGRKGLQARF